jgi:hypothetical protein
LTKLGFVGKLWPKLIYKIDSSSPRASGGDFFRSSPIRNSPKLELELLELVNLPSAPTLAMRNLHARNRFLKIRFGRKVFGQI